MRCRKFLGAVIVVLVTLGSAQAEASLLGLEATGAFGPSSTLGGTAFGADAAYSFGAILRPDEGSQPHAGRRGRVLPRFSVHDHNPGVRDIRGHPQ